MHESEETLGHWTSEARALDRLVRMAMQRQPDDSPLPSEEAVLAYLLGVATDRQTEEVQSALVSTPAFRREMLEAVRDLEHLQAQDLTDSFEKTSVPPAPALRTFLTRPTNPRTSDRRFGDRLGDFFRSLAFRPALGMGLIGAAAIAVILILLLPRQGPSPFRAGAVAALNWDLSSGSFVADSTGQGETETGITEETAQGAALRSFRQVVASRGGGLVFSSALYPPVALRSPLPGRALLRFVDEHGRPLASFDTPVPPAASDTTAVVLLLGASSRKLYKIRVRSTPMEVVWSGRSPDSGAVVFLFNLNGRFRASRAIPFKIQTHPSK